MKITGLEIKKDRNGRDYKRATLGEQVLGKDKFNVFPRHARYNDIQIGAELSPEDFVKDGDYINLIDPNRGIKGAYPPKAPSDKSLLERVAALEERVRVLENQPPF